MEGIIFVGIQASGKSTFYRQVFFGSHVRLSLDMLKTRKRESILMKACIDARQALVVDNTNPGKRDRKLYIHILQENNFSIKGYYFQSGIHDCLARNQRRPGKENIPEVGIRGTYNKLELPCYEEGFDELFYVSIKNNTFVINEWNNEI